MLIKINVKRGPKKHLNLGIRLCVKAQKLNKLVKKKKRVLKFKIWLECFKNSLTYPKSGDFGSEEDGATYFWSCGRRSPFWCHESPSRTKAESELAWAARRSLPAAISAGVQLWCPSLCCCCCCFTQWRAEGTGSRLYPRPGRPQPWVERILSTSGGGGGGSATGGSDQKGRGKGREGFNTLVMVFSACQQRWILYYSLMKMIKDTRWHKVFYI